MRIFTSQSLLGHDKGKRVEWIRWAMAEAGYPQPKRDFAIEAHVIEALRKAALDPLPDLPLTEQLRRGVGLGAPSRLERALRETALRETGKL